MPFWYTDFIFSAVGEELGMIGGLTVIGVFVVFLLRGPPRRRGPVRDAVGDRDRLLAGRPGSFENLGMNLGLLRVTRVPMPFVSYGGSSVIAALDRRWSAVAGLLALDRALRSRAFRMPAARWKA